MSSPKGGFEETIFALATPPGRSAIAIIRVSGPYALELPSMFHVKHLSGHSSGRQIRFARLLLDDGALLDEVMLVSMPAPASPTGEDVLEIHCHGSPAVIAAITQKLASSELCRPAIAGEFSRRAFDNGKMYLTELEGLADLIAADTKAQHRQASRQMSGALHKAASAWREAIIKLNAELEALIDFAEEDLPATLLARLHSDSQELITVLEAQLNDGRIGEVIRDGVQIVLIGPVNAGKSTTLNALARRPAAIISDRAGTTRDVIEVRLDVGGVPVLLRDTAGYRKSDDPIELEGIARARQAASSADLALLLLDISDPDWALHLHELQQWDLPKTIIIANKADRLSDQSLNVSALDIPDNALLVAMGGAAAEADLARLEACLAQQLEHLHVAEQAPLITRARHRDAITTAVAALRAAMQQDLQTAPELAAEEYRIAADALGRIVGQVDIEDLLDHIFSRFCIGK